MRSDGFAIDPPAESKVLTHLVRKEVRGQRAYRVETEVDEAAKLDQNESAFDLPLEIKEECLARFGETAWNRYPADRPHGLIAALADRLDWPAEGLIVGRGSNELTHTLGLCLIEPGMPVVLPRPMFALYESVVRLFGGRVVPVAPEPDFSHSVDAVLSAMRDSEAPLAVVCSPNNPTGHAFEYEALHAMAETAPGLLVIDEAYVELIEGPSALDLARERPNVLVMRTFSKAMGLAGMRLGYLAGHPDLIAEFEKARLPFLVDRLSEAVGIAMLNRSDLVQERVAEMKAERARLLDALDRRSDVETIPSVANFFLMRTRFEAAELQQRLLSEGVRIRNVSGYPELAGGPSGGGRFQSGWVRVCIGTRDENSAFMTALERVLR